MQFLSVETVLLLHQRLMQQFGGTEGLRDEAKLRAALAQPQTMQGPEEVHATPVAKAAALCCAMLTSRPFVDGNERTAHAAMEAFLMVNGYEIQAAVEEQESVVLQVSAGALKPEELAEWLSRHVTTRLAR
jgi:death-on-curing protein